jgi:hypothetical protein
MTSQETINKIMKFFFTLQILNKMYHLSTKSFSRHKASDEFDEKFQKNIDKFAEVYIGRYNIRPIITGLKFDQDFLSDNGIEVLFKQSREYIQNFESLITDTDLLNIRDEILADINQTLYLFNLK